MVSVVNQSSDESGYFFNIHVIGRENPFILKSESESSCVKWRNDLIEKLKNY
jgi:hypothetical protein